jgi:hypothetical protein
VQGTFWAEEEEKAKKAGTALGMEKAEMSELRERSTPTLCPDWKGAQTGPPLCGHKGAICLAAHDSVCVCVCMHVQKGVA